MHSRPHLTSPLLTDRQSASVPRGRWIIATLLVLALCILSFAGGYVVCRRKDTLLFTAVGNALHRSEADLEASERNNESLRNQIVRAEPSPTPAPAALATY